jgi:hypothetical protein
VTTTFLVTVGLTTAVAVAATSSNTNTPVTHSSP